MRPSIISLAFLTILAVSAAALTPADLRPAMSPVEQDYFDSIKSDQTAAKNFLITRDYVRKAQAVTSGSMPASSFPARKPAGFTVAYLLPDDPSTINTALGMYLAGSSGKSAWA